MKTFAIHPRLEADSVFVRDLPLSQLRLMNQKALPWLILVPRRPDMTELHHLTAEDQRAHFEEITKTSMALEKLFGPHKINVGILGNIVPQLHTHVIARFTSDPCWPHPVWGRLPALLYQKEEMATLVARINQPEWWKELGRNNNDPKV